MYFSDRYSYNNGTYTLINPQKYDKSNPDLLKGKYTLLSSSMTSQSKIYYVFSADTYIYYFPYEDGKTIEQAENDFNVSYKFGSSVVKNNDGTYTINGPFTTVKVMDYFKNSSVRSSINKMYTCKSMETTCAVPSQVYYTGYKYFVTLYQTGNYVFGNSVTYDKNTNIYTLTDTISTYDTTRVSNFNNYHYTCFNETGKCDKVKYLVYGYGWWEPYRVITFTDGKNIEDILYEMGFHNKNYDVNSYNDRFGSYTINQIDSNAKQTVENWYSNNMSQYSSYLNDTVYCNSRVFSNPAYYDPNGGAVNSQYVEFYNKSLECIKTTDQFTTSNQLAKLNYPVGLITYKEQVLNGRFSFSTMAMDSTHMQYHNIHNGYGSNYIEKDLLVRPVVTLKPTVEVEQGDGSPDNPYVIE